mmetsp:Transcript_12950/g.23344  ORF Transcript_12950/g.23344 Transcript_12950/m.23344 type:complete len:212 (+) Transcript_12950:2244-2879(+)
MRILSETSSALRLKLMRNRGLSLLRYKKRRKPKRWRKVSNEQGGRCSESPILLTVGSNPRLLRIRSRHLRRRRVWEEMHLRAVSMTRLVFSIPNYLKMMLLLCLTILMRRMKMMMLKQLAAVQRMQHLQMTSQHHRKGPKKICLGILVAMMKKKLPRRDQVKVMAMMMNKLPKRESSKTKRTSESSVRLSAPSAIMFIFNDISTLTTKYRT